MNDWSFELFGRHYDRIVRYLMAEFGFPLEDAQDLAQEAFLRVLRSNTAYREGAEWAFIKTTAHNVAVNWIRDRRAAKRSAVNVSFDDASEVRDAAERADDALSRREEAAAVRERLLRAIACLPEGTRLCYLLRRRGHSYEEIKDMLGITIDAVKSRLHDAKRRLREDVGELPTVVTWSDLAEEDNSDDER